MSKDMVYEDVPIVSRRQGDNVLTGQNNATILLGRDRAGSVDTGYGTRTKGGGKGAGAITAVAGRKGEDPSLKDDASTLYLSQKSDPDLQADTVGVGKFTDTEKSVAVLRADCVRIVPRNNFKLSVGKAYLTMTADGKVVIDGDVQLGQDAAERLIRGDAFAKVWASHVHPTPVGVSGPPQPLPENVFSSRNKCS